jgi:hypothetical protein
VKPQRAGGAALPRPTPDHGTETNLQFLLARRLEQASNGGEPPVPKFKYHGEVEGSVAIVASEGRTHQLLLVGPTVLSFVGFTPGDFLNLYLQQDGDGGHLVTWPSGVRFFTGVAVNPNSDSDTAVSFGCFQDNGGPGVIYLGALLRSLDP